ncbi:NAD(P)/FAD-dependent oxidoreductase [Promicromonospora soli]|uniref:FAD-dependent oxidoreductase n=1 Tax=Promicromonospora soli TaxID=2035533 RepID=A0A919KN80_9MICO|nr:FAD-binding oxidoreductase [Promicromonospora soli]GHH65629.1 FAD-dependent oxidoreductase [Promicromonospora soli]
MKLTPYWLDTATPSGDYRRTPVPERADIAIVGAGFTGLSAALEAAQHGASVVVLDSHTVGWGASGRNGGMATTGLAIGLGKAIKRYGQARGLEMFSEYNQAIDTIEELVKEHSIDCDFQRSGKLTLAMNAKQVGQMRQTQETLAKLADYSVTVVDKPDLHSEIGTDFYAGGMVDPLGAGVHVGKFVHGLAEAGTRAGVTICEDAQVTELAARPGGGHAVRTTRGVIDVDRVLVATSGYTGSLTPWLQRRTIPVGSFIIVTEPLPLETAQRILPRNRQAADNKMLTYYFRLTPDNRLLFGGRARFALSSPDSDLKSAEILKRAMSTLFPYLSSARVDYTWGGLVDLTMDQMVHAGERNGVHYSLGYSGHGVQMATYMGKQMALSMLGKPSRNLWEHLPYPAVPGHFGPPWFLPIIGGYAKVVDRFS